MQNCSHATQTPCPLIHRCHKITSLCIASSQKMNNSVFKYVSPCNRVETKRWLATVPAFLIVCLSSHQIFTSSRGFGHCRALSNLREAPHRRQVCGTELAQLWLLWKALNFSLSFEGQFCQLQVSWLTDFPPLYFEHSNTASKVSDEKFTNNLWFSAHCFCRNTFHFVSNIKTVS